jgi:hypothetical protein
MLGSLDSLREVENMNVYDNQGRKLGQLNEYGTASDNSGHKVGDIGEDGTVIDSHNHKVGHVSLSTNDSLYLAGGAALLLLLHPKQELA